MSLPTLLAIILALVDRKPAHLDLVGDTPDAKAIDMDIVITFEIDHGLPGSIMIGLPQIDDLRQYPGIRCPGTMEQATGTR